MIKDMFAERARGLENEFFYRVDQELIRRLREQRNAKDAREALAAASGIQDGTILDELLAAGIRAETLAAVSLVPLIQVAWADGRLGAVERHAVLSAAEEHGISRSQSASELLEQWLEQPPNAELFAAWNDLFPALAQVLSADSIAELKKDLWSRVCAVANAEGGVLGIGSVSAREKSVLKQIQATLFAA